MSASPPAAIVFDLDGVLVDTEPLWDEVRRAYVADHGGTWRPEATTAMMGMSSPEWARYLHDELRVLVPPERIAAEVADSLRGRLAEHLPVLPGAVETVRALAARWLLGLASSANRPVIEQVLAQLELRACFRAVVSSEEVPRGKPAPDVYEAAMRQLGAEAGDTVAVEDSTNGLRAALAADMIVVAVPNARHTPDPEVLDRAALVVPSLTDLTPAVVAGLSGG